MKFMVNIIHCISFTANFTNIPISKNVTTGDTVIFKCGHQRASSLAFRGFDNSSSCEYFNEFQNGMFLSRTIRCCQPYVFWNITCVASIDDGSPPEVTPPVCLQGICKVLRCSSTLQKLIMYPQKL